MAVIEHLFSHVLARKIDRRLEDWVAAGLRPEPTLAPDRKGCQLAFGWRYRLQSVLVCFGFGIVMLAFCWYYFTAQQPDFWLVVAYVGFVLPVFVLSVFLALGACTTRVALSTGGIVVRRFGRDSPPIQWCEISEVYRSPVTPAIVFVTRERRRVRISTQLNGMGALPEYLQLVPLGVVHRSIVEWMINLQ
jgi:hypothetical protein